MSGGYPSVNGAAGGAVVATFSNRFDWASGATYKVGDVVTVVGLRQVCREEHVSGVSPDLSKWTPTEGTDGFATTVSSVMTVAAAKPTTAGLHVFLVTPTNGLPSGVSLKDIAYYDGANWSVFRTYAAAPTQFQVGGVVWYKFRGAWAFDTEWDNTFVPQILATTTNPTEATVKTKLCRWRVDRGLMSFAFTYFAQSAAGSSTGSGVYKITIPSGYVIDKQNCVVVSSFSTSANSGCGAAASTMGTAMVNNSGNSVNAAVVGTNDDCLMLYLGLASDNVIINGAWGSNLFNLTAGYSTVKFIAEIPIKRIWE